MRVRRLSSICRVRNTLIMYMQRLMIYHFNRLKEVLRYITLYVCALFVLVSCDHQRAITMAEDQEWKAILAE